MKKLLGIVVLGLLLSGNAYADDINYQNYALNNKADKYQFTTGYADYDQNYSILSYSIVSSSFNTNYGA